MANVIGWSREDLEAPQAVDCSPGLMLHPVHLPSHQHQQALPSNAGEERSQEWQDSPTPPPPAKTPSRYPVPVEASKAPGWEPRILGLRRTTFLLTVSNIVLAIGIVVLGVVQNNVLKNGGVAATGSEVQASCPR